MVASIRDLINKKGEQTADGEFYTTSLEKLLGDESNSESIHFSPEPTVSVNSTSMFRPSETARLITKRDELVNKMDKEINRLNTTIDESNESKTTPIVIQILSHDHIPTRCETCCKVFCSCKHLCENGCCEAYGAIVGCCAATFATIGGLGGAAAGNWAYCQTNCWVSCKEGTCSFIAGGMDACCLFVLVTGCLGGIGLCCTFTGVTVAGAAVGAIGGGIAGAALGSVVGAVAAPAIVACVKAGSDSERMNELRKMVAEYNSIVEQLKKIASENDPQIAKAPNAAALMKK
jgi:hypothetical protein